MLRAAKDEEVKLGSDDWLAGGSNRAGRQPGAALEMTSALGRQRQLRAVDGDDSNNY